MAEDEQVLNAAIASGEKIACEPINRRVRIFANGIGVDDGEMGAAKIEAVREFALVGGEVVVSAGIGDGFVGGLLAKDF